jgi:hypothetical protein
MTLTRMLDPSADLLVDRDQLVPPGRRGAAPHACRNERSGGAGSSFHRHGRAQSRPSSTKIALARVPVTATPGAFSTMVVAARPRGLRCDGGGWMAGTCQNAENMQRIGLQEPVSMVTLSQPLPCSDGTAPRPAMPAGAASTRLVRAWMAGGRAWAGACTRSFSRVATTRARVAASSASQIVCSVRGGATRIRSSNFCRRAGALSWPATTLANICFSSRCESRCTAAAGWAAAGP